MGRTWCLHQEFVHPAALQTPMGRNSQETAFFSTLFSPSSVLIAKAGLWVTPFCHCFCRSSVILRTPLSFGLSSAPCCSCIKLQNGSFTKHNNGLLFGQDSTGSPCLTCRPLIFWLADSLSVPCLVFPCKIRSRMSFLQETLPFLPLIPESPSITAYALSWKVHPFLHLHVLPLQLSPLPVSSSLDSTIFQLRKCPWVLQLDTSAFPALLHRGDFLNVRYSCILTASTQSGGAQDTGLLFSVDPHTAAFHGYVCPLLTWR